MDRRSQTEIEERLDLAIELTFPASDPIAAGAPTGADPQFRTRPDGRPATAEQPAEDLTQRGRDPAETAGRGGRE
jgi:hypothetical protein